MPGSPRPESETSPASVPAASAPSESAGSAARESPLVMDLSGIDMSARFKNRAGIEEWIPHRGHMSLLDWIVWEHPTRSQGVGLKHIRDDEFWVEGHFPGKPMFPGVLMIETGAQLACYLYISRKNMHSLVAFLRIESAAFRASVKPGDDLYVLCNDVKVGRRGFVCDIQGLVEGKVTFDARISGMMF